uniref:Uncharacterized protein n=1 Tax=Arundo donax TaxID=35708 RepID=A0A0A8YK58_ARUDO
MSWPLLVVRLCQRKIRNDFVPEHLSQDF